MILGYWIDVKKCKSFIKDYYALDRHPTSLEIWISIFIDNFFHSIIAGFSKGFNIWYFSLYDGIGYFETFRFNFFLIIIIISVIFFSCGMYYIRCFFLNKNHVNRITEKKIELDYDLNKAKMFFELCKKKINHPNVFNRNHITMR